MSKTVRNSIFTTFVVLLTAVGLNWNKQIAHQANPVAIGQSVLASDVKDAAINFPLSVKFSRPRLELGQTQQLIVKTAPAATLDIATVYPDGSVVNDQTLRTTADDQGRYTLRFTVDSFRDLGRFQTVVVVTTVGGQKAKASSTFLAVSPNYVGEKSLTRYFYPLVP